MPERTTTPLPPDAGSSTPEPAQVKVWDLFVRVSHWTIVTAFFVAYLTEDDVLTLHVWAGYTVGALVSLRILWGFVGPRHARFSDFVYRPATVRHYLVDLLFFRARRYLGHSPAGGAMVVVLLSGLLATVWTGLELYAAQYSAGPLAAASAESALRESGDARERSDHERTGQDSVWDEIHEIVAEFVLVLVVLHLAGVGWASLAHRENLIRAMITGSKRPLG